MLKRYLRRPAWLPLNSLWPSWAHLGQALTKLLRQTLLFTLFIGVQPLHAAQQGTLGPTSTGSVDILLTTGLNARISGFTDLSLGTGNGSTDLTANDNICIGRTGVGFFASGAYRILASGDGEPGDPAAFTLYNGIERIYYDAYFNDQTGLTSRQQLTPGAVLTGQSGFGFWMILNFLFGCAVNNANISIVAPGASQVGPAGVYSGTLTLTLIPE